MAFDIVIVGGGLSGLALAVELAQAAFLKLRVLVLEQRQTYVRDRTWSYWKTPQNVPHRYSHLERHHWAQWRVQQGTWCQHHASPTAAPGGQAASYCTLDADTFYAAALHALSQCTHVELRLGISVQQILSTDTPSVVTSAGEVIAATWVFDARPPLRTHAKGLVQQFLGYEIKTDSAAFDVATVGLMHFHPSPLGLHFYYVLPYSSCNALVETTWISPASHKPEFELELGQYIAKLVGSNAYEVVYQEKGALTLDSSPSAASVPTASHVAPLGRAAGTLRASTGYAFLETLTHAKLTAASLKKQMGSTDLIDWLPPAFTRPALDVWMDTVFLKVLARDWRKGSGYFMELFERVDADTLVAFLSGSANWRQRLTVANALPPLPFAGQALLSVIGNWRGANR